MIISSRVASVAVVVVVCGVAAVATWQFLPQKGADALGPGDTVPQS